MQRFTEAEDYYDYVNGILFSKDQGAIIMGRLTIAVRTFSHTKDPWYYLHVRETITNVVMAQNTFRLKNIFSVMIGEDSGSHILRSNTS